MIRINRVTKRVVTAIVVVCVLQSSGPQSLWGDDIAASPAAADHPTVVQHETVEQIDTAKGGSVMEGTLPPPRTTAPKPIPPSKPTLPTPKPNPSTTKSATAPENGGGTARADRPRLGLNVNADQAVINKVYPDSGAAAAGVQPGGKIIAIDGHPVRNVEDLKRVIRDRTSLDTVTLQVAYRISPPRGRRGTQTTSIKNFRVPLGKPKVIYLELPAPVKEK
ncbi:secreted protein containing PDZ/DHR/GLGF domain protein [Rhodopirellula maiorica SM1]|uniref:Secreted protein containing PDZ/DHR/GLGF domain protein n=1 Tax=Rhodopirellula maiorica SM1 TaxID=1265738 RepID=M5RLM2_9BACT|nr:PDZ domain-containing protein [Rhodopirellula maiorica]EMI20210.1 secreted protein containing PDZ/DHR/GLGF domain protein [Rhodopirellula maiorica SM1]